MSTDAPVGFVGLGTMGWPMAHNLAAAGFPLVVRDADPATQERFAAEHPGSVAATAPSDFAGCGVVVTMLPTDAIVRAAIVDWDGGIAAHLASGAVVLDMSSSNPTGTRALAEELAPRGIAVVDAPVSGAVARARTGELSLMVGADDEAAFERVSPILAVLGSRVFRTGPVGSGHAMKALNNYLAAAAYTATAEALVIGRSYGLDPATMIEIINTSTGRSFSTEVVFGEHVVTGSFATGFALALLAKDVGIAAALADEASIEAPAVRLVADQWADASAALPGADHSRAIQHVWPTALEPAVEREA